MSRASVHRCRLVCLVGLMVFTFASGFALAEKEPVDITVLRGLGSPFTKLPSGEISNQIRIKLVNRSGSAREYRVDLVDPAGLKLVAPQNPVPLEDRRTETATIFVLAAPDRFREGEHEVLFRVSDGEGFVKEVPYLLLGPKEPRP